jgi:multisubunit Na+/H+ antiporter MnhF subunit
MSRKTSDPSDPSTYSTVAKGGFRTLFQKQVVLPMTIFVVWACVLWVVIRFILTPIIHAISFGLVSADAITVALVGIVILINLIAYATGVYDQFDDLW